MQPIPKSKIVKKREKIAGLRQFIVFALGNGRENVDSIYFFFHCFTLKKMLFTRFYQFEGCEWREKPSLNKEKKGDFKNIPVPFYLNQSVKHSIKYTENVPFDDSNTEIYYFRVLWALVEKFFCNIKQKSTAFVFLVLVAVRLSSIFVL